MINILSLIISELPFYLFLHVLCIADTTEKFCFSMERKRKRKVNKIKQENIFHLKLNVQKIQLTLCVFRFDFFRNTPNNLCTLNVCMRVQWHS